MPFLKAAAQTSELGLTSLCLTIAGPNPTKAIQMIEQTKNKIEQADKLTETTDCSGNSKSVEKWKLAIKLTAIVLMLYNLFRMLSE